MWCKTEQEGPGRLPDPARKRGKPPGIGRRSARNRRRRVSPGDETNDRPDSRRELCVGQNPAYSHHSAGALRQRGAPGLFFARFEMGRFKNFR